MMRVGDRMQVLPAVACRTTMADPRLDRKCGLGVSFDLMTGRLALDRETTAPVLAPFPLSASPEGRQEDWRRRSVRPGGAEVSADGAGVLVLDQRGHSAAAETRVAARYRGQGAVIGFRLGLLLRVIAFALARGYLTLDRSLLSLPFRTFAPESGLETIGPFPRARQRFARSRKRLMASPQDRA
jgi:hypothetical protein